MSFKNGEPLTVSAPAVATKVVENDCPVELVTVTVIVDDPVVPSDFKRIKPFRVSLKISIDLMITSLTGLEELV